MSRVPAHVAAVAAHVAAVAVLVARHIVLAAVVVRGMSASRYTHRRGAGSCDLSRRGKMHIEGM